MCLRVESFSSESEKGRAANAVDGSPGAYWEIDTTKDNYYRQFRVYVDDGSGRWKPVPEPPEHPFAGCTSRQGINNGETWALPVGTRARRLKIEFVSGYSDVIRLPEIRVYAGKTNA